MSWCGKRGEFRVARYWNPPVIGSSPARDFEATAERFWTEFRDSVARHRRSDVPIGVFLSGGVDSSSVAAALCEVEPARNVRTFSIGFEDPSFDESGHARAVARHLGTDHHERTFSVETAYELLPEVAALARRAVRRRVDPADSPAEPVRARAGQGRPGRRRRRRAPGRLSDIHGRACRRALPPLAPAGAGPGRRGGRAGCRSITAISASTSSSSSSSGARPSRCRWHISAGWARSPAREIARLLVDGDPIGVEAEHLRRCEAVDGCSDPLSRSLALYQDTYLPEDILTKVDRASMACGLEVRAPFLDAELVDFIQALPAVVQVRPQPDQAAAQARGGQPAAGVDPGSSQEGLRHPGGGAGCADRWPR